MAALSPEGLRSLEDWAVAVDASGHHRAVHCYDVPVLVGDRRLPGPSMTYREACRMADEFNEAQEVLKS